MGLNSAESPSPVSPLKVNKIAPLNAKVTPITLRRVNASSRKKKCAITSVITGAVEPMMAAIPPER